jgi:preprotein translocase subunit SecG
LMILVRPATPVPAFAFALFVIVAICFLLVFSSLMADHRSGDTLQVFITNVGKFYCNIMITGCFIP